MLGPRAPNYINCGPGPDKTWIDRGLQCGASGWLVAVMAVQCDWNICNMADCGSAHENDGINLSSEILTIRGKPEQVTHGCLQQSSPRHVSAKLGTGSCKHMYIVTSWKI